MKPFKLPFAQIKKATARGLPPADVVTLRTVLYGDAAAIVGANADALVVADFIRGGNTGAALELLAKTDAILSERAAFIEKLIAAYGGVAVDSVHEQELDTQSTDRENVLYDALSWEREARDALRNAEEQAFGKN